MLRYLSQSRIQRHHVLLRVDFNVPIAGGIISDDFRIRAHLPTIRRLLRGGNTVILLSHHSNPRQTLAPVAQRLESLLGTSILFVKNPKRVIPTPNRERLILIENLRFWPGEAGESRAFAMVLQRWGDYFVNDAFAVSHRRGASLTILPRFLPSCLGLLFEKELRRFDRILAKPKRPFIAVFGGAKIETKILLLRRFIRFADHTLVGGAIANTLLRARGSVVGRSAVARGLSPATLRRIAGSKKISLPIDAVVAQSYRGRRGTVRAVEEIGTDDIIFDIGPKTQSRFRDVIRSGRTVVWNGPLGLSEVQAFSSGTAAIARVISRSRGTVVVGGGDTVAFLIKEGLLKKFKHVSTGGGAMLAYLSGEKLPAFEALKKSNERKAR